MEIRKLRMMKKLILLTFLFLGILHPFIVLSQMNLNESSNVREHLLMDKGWRFSLGNQTGSGLDFGSGTSYFTYFAKAGYGDGPAAPNFEDRIWRLVDLPHDWAVELPFSESASHSHGYKTIGWKYPEKSVGWYRKTFFIPESDLGRKISIQFDGVYRSSIVWVNGFYLGTENSGYMGFEYDLTDYLNYGGLNVIAVRADASIEEGWYYEGAGIYRHTWLNKTNSLRVKTNGTFITTELVNGDARLSIQTAAENKSGNSCDFKIEQTLLDAKGLAVSYCSSDELILSPHAENTFRSKLFVVNPKLWSLEEPNLYKLLTKITSKGKVIDEYYTTIGIRTIEFDAKNGFFLNGKNVKLKGTNLHQDHAGVGVASPDALHEFRLLKLKEMGNNAIRTSHHPPTPELLDVCDRLGILVIDENRLMGVNEVHYNLLKRLIERDRNHPSVIIWSLGNEEWAIEGNILGERITATMQAYAQTLDSSRRYTAAISGGCGNGSSISLDVMGFNYLTQCDIDEYHRKYPDKPSIGTEESTSQGTRGIYESDKDNGHIAATDRTGEGPSIETGWQFYDARPFLSGLFFWTGFDYRGEPHPLKWPAVSSQFGILDACGFPKAPFYYLKSWWTNNPVLHISPHWNWKGKEGKYIKVWVYSNCDEVELFLNNKSLGRKAVIKNSHLEWPVKYSPGTIMAQGYKRGKVILTEKQTTSDEASIIQLVENKNAMNADGQDVSIITVQVTDKKGNLVPTADNLIQFSITGPAKIIGIGNGNPSSHEADCFIEKVENVKIEPIKFKKAKKTDGLPDLDFESENTWLTPFKQQENYSEKNTDSTQMNVIRGTFTLSEFDNSTEIVLFPKILCQNQSVFVNGQLIYRQSESATQKPKCVLDHSYLRAGKNILVISGQPLEMKNQWEILNTDPGSLKVVYPAPIWHRKLFNGLAQLIVQSTEKAGDITISATSNGLQSASLKLNSILTETKPELKSVEY